MFLTINLPILPTEIAKLFFTALTFYFFSAFSHLDLNVAFWTLTVLEWLLNRCRHESIPALSRMLWFQASLAKILKICFGFKFFSFFRQLEGLLVLEILYLYSIWKVAIDMTTQRHDLPTILLWADYRRWIFDFADRIRIEATVAVPVLTGAKVIEFWFRLISQA